MLSQRLYNETLERCKKDPAFNKLCRELAETVGRIGVTMQEAHIAIHFLEEREQRNAKSRSTNKEEATGKQDYHVFDPLHP